LGKGFVSEKKSIAYGNHVKLEEIITSPDKTYQLEKLIQYVEEEWYPAQSDTAWYNSHLENSETYFGYWCFECAALAVVLSLDTSKLKEIVYIPKDLL
jgi:hypothetical protein